MKKVLKLKLTSPQTLNAGRSDAYITLGIKSAPTAMDRKSICERLTRNWPPPYGQLLKKMATPPWANKSEIKAIYADCRRVSAETGIKHHVDHTIPLKGNMVCGLHTPGNLRIIPMLENIRKRNHYEDGQ